MRPLFPRGGARNRASRTSDIVTLKQAHRIIAATSQAFRVKRHFNRWITIHWEKAGLDDAQAMNATTAFLKYWREWLGGQTAYVWVRENGAGKGSHVHILAHLPSGRRLHGRRVMDWIVKITCKPYRAGIIETRKVKSAHQPDSALYAINLQRVLGYALKGAPSEVCRAFGRDHQPGGTIIGKRCGISRNLAQ